MSLAISSLHIISWMEQTKNFIDNPGNQMRYTKVFSFSKKSLLWRLSRYNDALI
jgi:hypothetical protein